MRLVAAGSATDCGHERSGGLFARGNTCASGGRPATQEPSTARREPSGVPARPPSPGGGAGGSLISDAERQALLGGGNKKKSGEKKSNYDRIAADPGYQSVCNDLFGREVHPKELVTLMAASVLGDAVGEKVRPDINWFPGKDAQIHLAYISPDRKIDVLRSIYKDERGNLTMDNENFFINDERLSGKGLGLKVFSNQVNAAIKMGVKKIKCHGIGNYREANLEGSSRANGYITWPKFGYDGYIPADIVDRKKNTLMRLGIPREDVDRGFVKVSRLMETAEGTDFWYHEGKSLDLQFDLTPGSYSREVLSLYRKKKGADPAEGPNRFHRSRP